MRGNDGIKKIFIIEILLFICWCLIVLMFTNYDKVGFYFWGGFGFGVLSFLVAGVSLLLIKTKHNRSTTEINYVPIYLTLVYLSVSIVINTYFTFRKAGNFNILLVIFNSVILVLFIGIRLYTDGYVARVDEQTRHSAQKIGQITSISSKLSILLCATTDPDIKKELLKVKEIVDYSSNVSQEFTENSQNLFLLLLNQIESMIYEDREKNEIIKSIEEAAVTWSKRNSVVSIIK